MTAAGDDYRQAVVAALAEDGRAMTLRQRTTGAYSNATGTAAVTESDATVFGLVTTYRKRDIDGTRVQAGDRMLILQGMGTGENPDVGDIVVDGDDRWSVMDVEVLDIDGSPFAFIVQGRKA